MVSPTLSILMASAATTFAIRHLYPSALVTGSSTITGSLLFTVLGFLYFTYSIIIYPLYLSPLTRIPHPPGGNWIMGHFQAIMSEGTGTPMRRWAKNIPNDGLIHYTTAFNAGRVMPTTAEGYKEVLSTKNYEFPKPPELARQITKILGNGVLFAEGEEHREEPDAGVFLQTSCDLKDIKDLYPIFWDKTRELVLALDGAFPGQDHKSSDNPMANGSALESKGETEDEVKITINIADWVSRATLDIVGTAAMDKSFGAIANADHNELLKVYKTIFNPPKSARFPVVLSFLLPWWLFKILPLQRHNVISGKGVYLAYKILAMTEASSVIKQVCREMIQEKKEKLARGERSGVDVLSTALDSGGFTDEELVNQLMTFLAAGHETTASTLTWAIYLLCTNLDIQARLREELLGSSPSSNADTPPTHSDTSQPPLPNPRDPSTTITPHQLDTEFPYLSAVCSEVLRHTPVVPFTLRYSAKDNTIQGHFVPKGTTVVVAPAVTNESEELWGDDAEVLDPERWLIREEVANGAAAATANGGAHPGKRTKPHGPQAPRGKILRFDPSGGATSNYAFLTFLSGPRSCIGQQFARAEFAAILAGLVRCFEWSMEDPEMEFETSGGLTVKPRGGLEVRVGRVV
ncbi:MAG: hypothetical protein M1831_004064 [Alyxoria varia]|nr:MAG: hypothetical protein M1831_004064 [Alyxoria varia]